MGARQQVLKSLWFGRDPFTQHGAARARSDEPAREKSPPLSYLAEAVDALRPRLAVAVDAERSGAALALAARFRALDLDAVVIAVDTWLGSSEHWLDPRLFAELASLDDQSGLYRRFAQNILARGLQDHVVPLPLDGADAARVLAARDLRPSLLHLAPGRDLASVTVDLRRWWPLLRPGGVLIGEGYGADGPAAPHVKAGFDSFFETVPLARFESREGTCVVEKLDRDASVVRRERPAAEPDAAPRSVTKIGFALGRATRAVLARK